MECYTHVRYCTGGGGGGAGGAGGAAAGGLDAAAAAAAAAPPRAKREASSRYVGVYKDRGKWTVQIAQGGRQHYLGRYPTEEDAAAAYAIAAEEIKEDGEFQKRRSDAPGDRRAVGALHLAGGRTIPLARPVQHPYHRLGTGAGVGGGPAPPPAVPPAAAAAQQAAAPPPPGGAGAFLPHSQPAPPAAGGGQCPPPAAPPPGSAGLWAPTTPAAAAPAASAMLPRAP